MYRNLHERRTVNSASSQQTTKAKHAVKASVGEIATITVDLVKRGVAVYRIGDVCNAEDLVPGEEHKWFVSTPADSPLADKVKELPLASSENEAWELAIQYLATYTAIAEDLRAGIKTHRRTLRRVWKDIRDHAEHSLCSEMHAAEHYGYWMTAWSRLICWMDGAATGFFNDNCWMPLTWRITGRTPAEWDAFVVSTWDSQEPEMASHEEPAAGWTTNTSGGTSRPA